MRISITTTFLAETVLNEYLEDNLKKVVSLVLLCGVFLLVLVRIKYTFF